MPRRKNDRFTFIYWIADTRPEVIAQGFALGKPFYCGKTVYEPEKRLFDHMGRDSRRFPHRPIAKRLVECNGHVAIRVMEEVPVGEDWAARERYWISVIRRLYPDCVNVADGGEGGAGCIPSEE